MKALFRYLFLAILLIGQSVCLQWTDSSWKDIEDLAPGVILDIRYAGTENFTHQAVYPCARCLLRQRVAERLARVAKGLEKKGYRLVIYDCYRPLSVQWRFWELVPDPRFVADPRTGSKHNRGAAVDVGLADLDGNVLEMPSEFDEFSERAHRNFQNASPRALLHRSILSDAMTGAGFLPNNEEWWHFDSPEWEIYPISDDPLCPTQKGF